LTLTTRGNLSPLKKLERERKIKGKKFKLDTSLCKELEDKIAGVISENMNAFALSSADIPGIDPDFLLHQLTMDEKVKLLIQRRRKFNAEKRLTKWEETRKLLAVVHCDHNDRPAHP